MLPFNQKLDIDILTINIIFITHNTIPTTIPIIPIIITKEQNRKEEVIQ